MSSSSSSESEHYSSEPKHSSSESEHSSSESEHSSSESDSYRSELLSDQPPSKKPKTMTLNLNKDEEILQIREKTSSGLRLANQVFQNPKFANKNAVLSPLSIHIALSMVAAGAAGLVKDQIVSFLGANSEEQLHSFASKVMHVIFSDSSASGGPRLSAANAVWLRDSRTFKSSFKQAMETDYNAVTRLLDFSKVDESVREVNEWAEKETNGLIKGIVNSNSLNTETVLVLANALYFKGSWHKNFYPKLTKHHAFYLIDGTSSVRVPFMCKMKDKANIGIYDTFKVLNLAYRIGEDDMGKRSFSMSIFLPNDIDGLPSLIQRVFSTDDEKGNSFLYHHISSTKEVHVGNLRIPKFKIEVEMEAMDVVEQMGLKMGKLIEMVEEEVLQDEPGVVVSSIVQKTFVEVNEEGTKAAAVNRMLLPTGSARLTKPPVYVDFIADHPFMFVIQEDNSGLVLFAGQVLDPTK